MEEKLEIMNQSLTSLLDMKFLMETIIRKNGDMPFRDMARESRNMGEEMELPNFDGSDSIGWLSKAEQ